MSRVVFVGSIPFEMTEEQIIEIFKEVGPVVSFRLVFDRETGKPKGFGFCEFLDAETASSAIRNLNGYDVGGRQLIVSTADNNAAPSTLGGNYHLQPHQIAQNPAVLPQQPIMPVLTPLNATPSFGIEAINALLASQTNEQLAKIILDLKNLANTNPAQATQFFQANPALAYAIFQSLLNMKLVDPGLVQELTNQQRLEASHEDSQQIMQPPVASHSSAVPTSPTAEEQQRALIAQIMSLTDEQISLLPEQQRQQVLLVREQLGRK